MGRQGRLATIFGPVGGQASLDPVDRGDGFGVRTTDRLMDDVARRVALEDFSKAILDADRSARRPCRQVHVGQRIGER